MIERENNQRVADQICTTGSFNGQLFHSGECVALLDGKVVAVGHDMEEVLRVLRSVDPDPHRGMVLEVGPLVTDVIR
jgi:hypothetical protein